MRKILKVGGIGCLGIIVLSIIVALLAGDEQTGTGTTSRRTEPTDRPTPTRIVWTGTTADTILAAYEDNEIAAGRQFADRPLEIHGFAGHPDYAPFTENRYLIPVQSSDMFMFTSLSCEIDVNPDYEAWVLSLRKGVAITVRGYIRDNMEFGVINLEECTPVP